MCGRYWLGDEIDSLCLRYDAEMKNPEGYIPTGEVFPSFRVPVVVRDHGQGNSLRLMRWGFPGFQKRGMVINARAETADTRPMFRRSFRQQRCIVPVNAFFEWKKEGIEKIKYRIDIQGDGLFSLAGLFDIFEDNGGEEYAAFVIITTSPLPTIRSIHDRMPAILSPEKEAAWLDKNVRDVHLLKGCLQSENIIGLRAEKALD
ncbi:MAG: SOS response-associated peptidase [Firmicutes bacterium]|jgi:putative SOS response-associated peptidase YedK|nr:SOS response-associated peptidase [Bacillota bacterium]